MKRKGVLTCGPSTEIVKFPYVVVEAAGRKVGSSVLGEAVFTTLPFSPTSFILFSCKLVATESFLYVVLKMGSTCVLRVPWTDTKQISLSWYFELMPHLKINLK